MIENAIKPNGFRAPYFYLTIGTIGIIILSLALPIMTLQIYDRVLPNHGVETLTVLTAGVCLAIVMETILRLCRDYLIKKTGAAFDHLVGCRAFDCIMNADLSSLGRKGIGGYIHQMAAAGRIKDYYNGQVYITIIELMFLPLYLGFIFYISLYLGFVPIVILTMFFIVSICGGRCLRGILKVREKADDKRFDFLIESLEGIHPIKANALEPFFQRRYEQLEEESTRYNYKLSLSISNMLNLSAVFSNLMIASTIMVGAWCVINGQLTSGSLIACLLLSGRVMQPVQKILGVWVRQQDYKMAKNHVNEILNTPQSENGQGDAPLSREGELELKDINFQYNGADTVVLSNVDLHVKPGQTILFSGDFGAGKTTLLNIIAGVIPPQSGTVLIDREPIEHYTSEQLINRVAYIPAQAVIFRGTIRDNMTCFGQISEDKAQDIAKLLNVGADIAALPGGFDTFLSGDNTDLIPPGLKQRIAIVRALAPKPRIIIYDNADQSLDKNGYQTLYTLLAKLKGKVALILVSNDHNIQALADEYYTLANGVLSRQDTHDVDKNIIPYRELRI